MILDDLFTAAEQQQLADQLETALRGLVDLLTDEGDLIATLIRIRDVAMPQALAALDAHESAERVRVSSSPRLCGHTEQPVSTCTCRTCTTRREDVETTSAQPDPPPPPSRPDPSTGHCATTGKAARSCTCHAHVAWRASGAAGDQECRTCGRNVPVAEYTRLGGGWSSDCPECVAERNGRARRKDKGTRESSDDKEPV